MDTTWSGSAKKLLGNCLAVGIFVAQEGEEWDLDEKSETWKKVETAMGWITDRAGEYEVEVNFECLCLNPDSDATIPDLTEVGSTSGNTDAANHVAEQLGYENAGNMVDRLREEYPSYNIHILFILNSENIANHNNINVGDDNQVIDVCMIHKEMNHGTVLVSTITHESLHAFGAIDLYLKGEEPASIKAAKLIAKKFPNEIMICATDDMDVMELSELTAFYLGWHGDPKPWYKTMVDPYHLTVFNFLMNNHQYYDEQGELIISLEEELLRYSYEDGEFIRVRLNEDDNLILWRHSYSPSGELFEFWEIDSEGEFHVLEGKTDEYARMEMPKENGGMSFSINQFVEPETREEWYEMTLVES
jgi:hypothetical protein